MARTSDYQYGLNLARVEDLIVQGYAWPKIVSIMITEGYTENAATVWGWRKAVYDRWAQEEREARPARKDAMRARLERLFCESFRVSRDEEGNPLGTMAASMARSECTKIAKLSMMLDGLVAPIVTRNEGLTDPAAMSPNERDQEIKELLEKREAALAATMSKQGN